MPSAELDVINTALEDDSLRRRLDLNLDRAGGEKEPCKDRESQHRAPEREHRPRKRAPSSAAGGDGGGLEGNRFDGTRRELPRE